MSFSMVDFSIVSLRQNYEFGSIILKTESVNRIKFLRNNSSGIEVKILASKL